MTRDELIKQCRYYMGQDSNPFEGAKGVDQDKSMFWEYERIWVERDKGEYEDSELSQSEYLSYPCVKAANSSEPVGSVPVSLQLLLFNRYVHWLGGYQSLEKEAESYIKWLKKAYFGE